MIKVLFLCMGNICRSPMAEAVFQDMVNKAGLHHVIAVDSAGTGGWHVGETAHRGTRQVLADHGIQYIGRARQISRQDLQEFDYILGMDSSNLHNIRWDERKLGGEVCLFLSYANDKEFTRVQEVPDPYYSNNFDEVYKLVTVGSQAFLDYLIDKHELEGNQQISD